MQKLIVIYSQDTQAMNACRNLIAKHFKADFILKNWYPQTVLPVEENPYTAIAFTNLDKPTPDAIHFKDAMEQIAQSLGQSSNPVPYKEVQRVPYFNPTEYQWVDSSVQTFWEDD